MEPIIEVSNIRKVYKKRKSKETFIAVKDISFTVNKGEIVGLLGPNGAGKTTTIKSICGLLVPDEGDIYVNGYHSVKERQKALRHISAVLEGNRNVYWRLTVEENLEYFAGNRGMKKRAAKQRLDELLSMFHLEEKRDEVVNNLSRGMQQKVAIAVALMADTDVILLDEPTLGLDVETSYEVRDLLKRVAEQEGKTIIISTHDMAVVQDLCARTVIINQGAVIADESVQNLLRLFETSAYKIDLKESLNEEQLLALQHQFPIHNLHDLTLEVNLDYEEAIYQLMNILAMNRTGIYTMNRTEVNFEQVFRMLVKEEAVS